jgi:uncharacterized protein (TIGR03437 family)
MQRYKVLFLFLPICAFGQPKYTIQDLGTLPNLPSCTGTAISQSGQVAGYCNAAGGSIFLGADTHPFLYANGTLTDLGAPGQPAAPTGVNDSGVVVGSFVNVSLVTGLSVAPFIYQNGSIQRFAGIPPTSAPFGLTNTGQSASTDLLAGGLNFFVSSEPYEITTAGTSTALKPSSGSEGVAFGISPSGEWIAGGSGSALNGGLVSQTPTVWHNGTPQAFPLAPNFDYNSATGVNDSGMAAGAAFTYDFTKLKDPNATGHAVLFNNGAVTDLGVLGADQSSAALAINNSGTVVGFSNAQIPDITIFATPLLEGASPSLHAFVYTNGTMYDLTRQLVNGSGWQLTAATAINNAGQIAGTGIIQQQQHAFLLTPVALPQIDSVVGAAFSVPTVSSLSANGMFSISGTGFADPSVKRNVTGSDLTDNFLPTNLANTCVLGGSVRWGLLFVSAEQINAVADPLTTSGTVPVSVITNCDQPNETPTAPFNVTVAAETPQFFFFVGSQNGQNEIAARDASSNDPIGPPGLIPNVTTTPAHAGEVLTAYGAGWGATDPAAVVGSLAAGAATITGSYTLTVGGEPAVVLYAGLAPTYAGLYQINFTVPTGLTPGNQPIVLTINGVATPVGSFLAVQ